MSFNRMCKKWDEVTIFNTAYAVENQSPGGIHCKDFHDILRDSLANNSPAEITIWILIGFINGISAFAIMQILF